MSRHPSWRGAGALAIGVSLLAARSVSARAFLPSSLLPGGDRACGMWQLATHANHSCLSPSLGATAACLSDILPGALPSCNVSIASFDLLSGRGAVAICGCPAANSTNNAGTAALCSGNGRAWESAVDVGASAISPS